MHRNGLDRVRFKLTAFLEILYQVLVIILLYW